MQDKWISPIKPSTFSPSLACLPSGSHSEAAFPHTGALLLSSSGIFPRICNTWRLSNHLKPASGLFQRVWAEPCGALVCTQGNMREEQPASGILIQVYQAISGGSAVWKVGAMYHFNICICVHFLSASAALWCNPCQSSADDCTLGCRITMPHHF